MKGARSGLWRLIESYSTQIIQFAVQILLTRILLPNDFAAMALLVVVISFGAVLIEGGLSSALVQRVTVDETDRSTAFFLSFGVGVVLYALVVIGAPSMSAMYAIPELEPALRVLGALFLVGAFNSIQVSVAMRNLQFRALMIARLVSQIGAGAGAIVAALSGLGIWSLVILNLTGGLLNCIILAWFVRWRPKMTWSLGAARDLLGYGWRVLAGSLAYTSYLSVYSLVLGRVPDGRTLGFFDRGRQIPSFLVNTFNSAIGSVSFPYFSKMQDNRADIRKAMARTLRLSAAVSVPAALGLFAIAQPLVEVVLGVKWLPAVFFLRAWALYFLFSPLANVNQQAVKAIGKVHIYLRCELLEVLVGILLVLSLWHLGVQALMVGLVISGAIGAIIHAAPSGRVFGFGVFQQLRSLRSVFVASSTMFVIVLGLGSVPAGNVPLLLIQVAGGVLVYVGSLELLKAPELRELIGLFRSATRPGG